MISPKVLPKILKQLTTGCIEISILMNEKGEEISYFATEECAMSDGFLGGENIKEDISFVGAMVSNLFNLYSGCQKKLKKRNFEDDDEEEEGDYMDEEFGEDVTDSDEEEEEGEKKNNNKKDNNTKKDNKNNNSEGKENEKDIAVDEDEDDLEFIKIDFKKKLIVEEGEKGGGGSGKSSKSSKRGRGKKDKKNKEKEKKTLYIRKSIIIYQITERVLLCCICNLSVEGENHFGVIKEKLQLISEKLKRPFEKIFSDDDM